VLSYCLSKTYKTAIAIAFSRYLREKRVSVEMSENNQLTWLNPPVEWKWQDAETLEVKTAAKTDFWRLTHYGFIRDNGHFYYQSVAGDFKVSLKVAGNYRDLYDQAGLMVRLDEKNWLKCGIEFVDGIQNLSVVVTRDYSDWSILPLTSNPVEIWLEVRRKAEAIEVHYSLTGEINDYHMLRMTYLTTQEELQVGLMCASPDGEGFSVTFSDFKFE
jgi:uncharacterized protein